MALSFVQKATGNGAKAGSAKPATLVKPAPLAKAAAGKPAQLSFLKQGLAAKQALQAEDAKAELAKQESSRLWRFWMPVDEERTITFLDGTLDDEQMLDVPMFYEHQVRLNGKWETFVCVADSEPCPICEKGESRSSLVGILTVIDHTPHKIKKGPNAGKVIKDTKKLFVAKRQSLKKLAKKAAKTHGLAGCAFEVSRTGDKEPSVGSDFEFVEQLSASALMAKYGLPAELVQPADYSYEIVYRTAAELAELGIAKAVGGVGHEKEIDTSGLVDEL